MRARLSFKGKSELDRFLDYAFQNFKVIGIHEHNYDSSDLLFKTEMAAQNYKDYLEWKNEIKKCKNNPKSLDEINYMLDFLLKEIKKHIDPILEFCFYSVTLKVEKDEIMKIINMAEEYHFRFEFYTG